MASIPENRKTHVRRDRTRRTVPNTERSTQGTHGQICSKVIFLNFGTLTASFSYFS